MLIAKLHVGCFEGDYKVQMALYMKNHTEIFILHMEVALIQGFGTD